MMKKLFFLTNFFVLFLLVSVNAQEATDSTTAKKMDPQAAIYYNSGVELMKSGKYEDAIVRFDSSLTVTKDPRTYYMKGQALMKTNNMPDAKKAFETCLSLDSTYDQAAYALGNANLVLKNYDDAISSYEQAKRIAKTPAMKDEAEKSIALATDSKAIEFFNKGNELAKENKFDEAIKSYDQALAINNKDYKTYYQKGFTQLRANKIDDAIASFKSSLAINDSFDVAYMALAGAQTQNKEYEAAIKSYEKAISVTQNEAVKNNAKEGMTKTYVVLGNQYYKEKKFDKAVDAFKKATEMSDFDQAYLGLGKSLIEKKQYDNALAALDKASQFKKTVTDGAISYYKGVLYMNKGDKAKAVENFSAGAKDPNYKKACESQIAYMKAKEEQDKGKKK
ncbi:MAG: tetratricopeptide repeat protein [Bacteroidota bacterium]|nr:tetratricopeptide repeat protein [Bacteroidota bacterium]